MYSFLHADARVIIEMSYLAAITPSLWGGLYELGWKMGILCAVFVLVRIAPLIVFYRLQSVLNPKSFY